MSLMRALIERKYREMLENASDDFRICWLAGVPMETVSQKTREGMTITMRTAAPVAVRRDSAGLATVFIGRKPFH